MNLIHRWMCRSDLWRKRLQREVMPWALDGVELGEFVLEVGPGPGLTTDLLRPRAARITALEIDEALARALALRLRDTNVAVAQGDTTAMPFADARFTGAVSFTMLHHVPSAQLQDLLLQEVRRVLRPGGTFAGVDSRQSFSMRLLHIADTLVPVDPDTFGLRLQAAGFQEIVIQKNDRALRFHARRPKQA